VLPGKVMQELFSNDRVIGGMTPRCSDAAMALYKTFVQGDCVITNARTAEMAKLTENSFRDVNIAFANELSVICDQLDIDVWELIGLANRHPRVNILQPGPGVGGHCIAVDPWFIVSRTPQAARLIRTARLVNDDKPEWVVEKVLEGVARIAARQGCAADRVRIACYGLAFKPDIDDLRESPALGIVKTLAARHAGALMVVEPNIRALPSSLKGPLEVGQESGPERGVDLVDLDTARTTADLHVMLVGHREFKDAAPPQGYLVDAQGVWRLA